MRLFFLLLAFANLILFAWAQGYFGLADTDHEPQRMTQQLHPDKIRVLPLAPQAAAQQEAIACRLVSGLSVATAEAIGASIDPSSGAKAKVVPIAAPEIHVAMIGELAGKVAADKKFAELARLGLEGHKVIALEDGRHEIRLGEFPTDAAAREFLAQISRRGVRSARVEVRAQNPVAAQVEIRATESTLQRLLPQLVAPHAEAVLGECTA